MLALVVIDLDAPQDTVSADNGDGNSAQAGICPGDNVELSSLFDSLPGHWLAGRKDLFENGA